ncbi:uncharacterized protein [Amphiura filiformis]|uniref:uncharacterized protein n=1 Tax=Amphiura filiformis TaxID=82378 RepID=UPI003B20D6F9
MYQHPNDVCIAGYSEQILRFVAERGNGGQLNHVENIDKAYGLQSNAMAAIARQGVSRQVSIQPQKPLPILASQQTKRSRMIERSRRPCDMCSNYELQLQSNEQECKDLVQGFPDNAVKFQRCSLSRRATAVTIH